MNINCSRWSLTLLMAATAAVFSSSPAMSGMEGDAMPELPPDTRCTMSVSSPVVDYGIMSRWQLQDLPGGNVTPGNRTLTLSVACPYKRKIKLLVQGEGSHHGGIRYGDSGSTRFRMLDTQLDGNAVALRLLTSSGTLTDSGGKTVELNAGQQVAPERQGQLAEGRNLTARLEIQPMLADYEARVTSRQRSESMLTLTLVE